MVAMRRCGALVVVSGVDGAGKSTQIARLEARLRARGARPLVFWHRPGYSPELDALRRVVRRLRGGALPPPGPSAARERAFGRPSVRAAWLATALLDTFAQHALKVRTMLAAGRTVICDRGLADARLDLALRFPEAVPLLERLWPAIEASTPRPDVSLLLLVSPEEARRRSEAKREPFPDPPEVRLARDRAYRELAGREPWRVIDAEADVETVAERVWREVAPVLGLSGEAA